MRGKFLAAFFDGLCGAVQCKRSGPATLHEAGLVQGCKLKPGQPPSLRFQGRPAAK